MTRIALLGATGGCVDILDTIQDANDAGAGFEVLGFLDDKRELWGSTVLGAPVLGGFAMAGNLPADCLFVTGIGSPYNHWRRGAIIAGLGIARERFATIRHPTASVSRHARLGPGTVLHQYAVVTAQAELGDHVLVLPHAIVNHGSRIGDFTIITSAAVVSGDVTIGRACYLGSQCAIRQNVTIGDGAMIGMGAVVVDEVAAHTVVAGSPARFLRTNGSPRGEA